ncbi:MAG: HAD-IIB family hydrolase, partial [Bacteroidota bacterium]
AATKILAIGSVEQADTWLEALQKRLGDRLYITKSQANFLELAPLGISKGEALAFLAESLGVAREEVVAFGDGMNDAEMLTYAGLGVAMGNAADGLKKFADRVAPSIHEEGLAQVLEELF